MDDLIISAEVKKPRKKRTSVKTSDVKRLKREGFSNAVICNKLGISNATLYYHLAKKRKDAGQSRVKASVNTVADSAFEAELFGTIIRLDKAPSSIERVGNRIIIK